MKRHVIRILSLLAVLAPVAQAQPSLLYGTEAMRTLPGAGHSWGFGALDSQRPYLFIARRDTGLTVFDVEHQQAVKTLKNSQGANAVALVPRHGRAFVANLDGSVSVVDLNTLTVLKRVPVDSGNLNNAVYDTVHDRVLLTSGRRGDHSTLYFFDPGSARITASRDLPAHKLDGPLLLDDGRFMVPMRDEDSVAVLSGEQLASLHTWQYPACSKPSALAADETGGQLFIACRGKQPTLIVADLATGTQRAALPITAAVNTLAWDTRRQQLLIPSGADASLTVVQRDADGAYRLLGAVGTRPWAHNMVFDAVRGRVYLFTADFTQPAPGADGIRQDPQFHGGTFTVLTLKVLPDPKTTFTSPPAPRLPPPCPPPDNARP